MTFGVKLVDVRPFSSSCWSTCIQVNVRYTLQPRWKVLNGWERLNALHKMHYTKCITRNALQMERSHPLANTLNAFHEQRTDLLGYILITNIHVFVFKGLLVYILADS